MNDKSDSTLSQSRRDVLKKLPLILGSSIVMAKDGLPQVQQKADSSTNAPALPVKHKSTQELHRATQHLSEFISQRRQIRSALFKSITYAAIELADIEKDDFFEFSKGRIDRLGNYVGIKSLQQQKAATESILTERLPWITEANEYALQIGQALQVEERILQETAQFLGAFRSLIRSIEQQLYNMTTDDVVLEKAAITKIEYNKICDLNGNLTGLTHHLGELKSAGEATRGCTYRNHGFVWSGSGNGPSSFCTGPSMCCQTNMTCESDTVDCGLFDNCEKDTCGVGDGGSCTFYDGDGCKCNVEDT